MSLSNVLGKRSWILVVIVLTLSAVFAPSALASGIDVKVGDVNATVYAPSVVWQATNAHVIVKLENTGSKPVTIDGLFKFPEGKDNQFTYSTAKAPANVPPKEGVTKSLKDLKPGESKYIAFTYITPKGSAQLGQYTANVTLKVDGASQTIPWTFDVRTGTVFVAETQSIVMLLYGISAGMLVFWFIYFKGFVNKKFNILAGEEQ